MEQLVSQIKLVVVLANQLIPALQELLDDAPFNEHTDKEWVATAKANVTEFRDSLISATRNRDPKFVLGNSHQFLQMYKYLSYSFFAPKKREEAIMDSVSKVRDAMPLLRLDKPIRC